MMNPILKFLFVFAALCWGASTAAAGGTASIDSLEREVARLGERSRAWDAVLERLPRISGYVQMGFEADDAATSQFFLKRARVILQGDLTRTLDYCVHAELVSPQLMDLYLRYRPLQGLNLQLGQYKIPFSIENIEYPPLRIEFIDYPLVLVRLMSFNDLCGITGATGRDIGLTLFGNFIERNGRTVVGYHVGLFNGEGINTRDANRSKDLVARLAVRPAAGLEVVGSWYRGEYGPRHMLRLRYGAGACYDRGIGVLRAEYIYGRTGGLRSEGWYAMGALRATPKWMVALRAEGFTENLDTSGTRQNNYTAGLTWQPLRCLRCQLDYTYEHHMAASLDDRNVVAFMVSANF